MNLLNQINRIQWKYVIGANLAVVVLAGMFASMQPAVSPTDNRSNAKEPVAMPLTQVRIDPQNPPELLNTDPDWAKVGDAIVVNGRNLGKVPFGTLFVGDVAVPHQNIIEWQSDYIVFTVPSETSEKTIKLVFNASDAKTYELRTNNVLKIRKTNSTP